MDGTAGAAKMASLQGSLFVKHFFLTFFGHDGSAIAIQADRIQEVFGYYTTVVDFHQFSELVNGIQDLKTSLFATIQGLTVIQKRNMIS